MDMFENALDLLPADLKVACGKCRKHGVEEIRLRLGRAPSIITCYGEMKLSEAALSRETLERVFERACSASIHSHLDEMSKGYINHKGLRIGFGATAVIKNGQLASFKDFSSLNIRIPSVFTGDIGEIYHNFSSGNLKNILIVSPPGSGKTTLLRELIRLFSNDGVRVSVADERNEIAASNQGSFYFDLGKSTDVIVGLDKKTAAMFLLRSMNPQIIALDEISRREDMDAVFEIVGCGVKIIATMHGESIQELRKRDLYRNLLDEHIFTDAILIESTRGDRKYIHTRLG